MFDNLLSELTRDILEHGGKKLFVPNEFCERVSTNGNCKLNSWLWDVPEFRRWRVTRLNAGDRLQVLNSVAYPHHQNDMPIMGIDLLWFEKKEKLVAILDFQPLVQDKKYFDRYFDGLKSLKKCFNEFDFEMKSNIYDPTKYFSPWALFCKGDIFEAENILPKVFSSFLKYYWVNLDLSKANKNYIKSHEVKLLHIDYDKYSAEKDPAHGLFSSFFGKEWSEKYMKEFLFPLSLENINSSF
ncbi:15,16-dihydrobiliverdin:ferredoxin oxidoreductase [Prochlorococcus marinus]|uniref:15,16-dihydrobiliverdin:ferredoxin oxidoreductase n=1 Tax=Prochlorococcus marinus TaxID=1219 RepID=UPI0022B5E423|nr:15,16-dihydrobiliverdin:ferredoxin oxidoreductase [Prochlorococcus marinus]